MRVNALVVDLGLLGAGAWDFLERVSAALPGLGIVVCTGRSTRLAASARPAARRRRLGHEALPPRGGPRAGGGRRAAGASAPRRGSRAARSWPATSRSAPISSRRSSRAERRPHPPRVRGPAAARAGGGQGPPARGDLPGGLGLCDGPRRPLGRRLHPQGAPEAREGVARLELHPHALRRRLPLRHRSAATRVPTSPRSSARQTQSRTTSRPRPSAPRSERAGSGARCGGGTVGGREPDAPAPVRAQLMRPSTVARSLTVKRMRPARGRAVNGGLRSFVDAGGTTSTSPRSASVPGSE